MPLKIILNFFFTLLFAVEMTADAGEFKTIALNGAAGNLAKSGDGWTLQNSVDGTGIFFAHQPFAGNGQIIARVRRPAGSTAKIGVMFRQNLSANALSAGTFLTGGDTIFERQTRADATTRQTVQTNKIYAWLRVVREGDSVSGFVSHDGTNWNQFSADTMVLPEEIFAGVAVIGKGEATVEQIEMTSARLTSPTAKMNFLAPTNILFQAEVNTFGGPPVRLDFFAESQKIKTWPGPPYQFTWTNILGGQRSFTARVVDAAGNLFFAEPVNVEVKLPPAKAEFLRTDVVTKGNWKGVYGREGFVIINDQTNLPSFLQFTAENVLPHTWGHPTNENALLQSGSTGRIAAAWSYAHPIQITAKFADGYERQMGLYFLDWTSMGRSLDVKIANLSGKILSQQHISDFGGGKYFLWRVQGGIRIQIQSTGPGNTVLSGIFFDN
ncbi:MAG: hypothetical protein ABJC04_08365 [Verrucomicrobiota bacterium]